MAGAEEYRQCGDRALEILAAKEKPTLSAAVGLRQMKLSPEASNELRRLLKT